MYQELISHSPDLKELRDEGFEIELKEAFLLIHHVPYVNSEKEIKYGTLVSTLNLAGQKTVTPDTHVIHFIGEYPCNKDGKVITGIQNASQTQTLAEDIIVHHTFSNKPHDGFQNYYDKISSYVNIISAPARSIDASVTAKTFKPIPSDNPDIPLQYLDTNSSRAHINPFSAMLLNLKIAIVGMGGTGSYVLDFVSKTLVKEIHLFDDDVFLQHNAFRAPGAASIDDLLQKNKKVNYLKDIYSRMHKGIIAHDYPITESNIEEVYFADFIFICMDGGKAKKFLIEKLIEKNIPFVDVGIGLNIEDEKLFGQLRVTLGTPEKHDHISKRISFANDQHIEEYDTNIQIAELNALNAALAVIRWKKLFNFYYDEEHEYNNTYSVSSSMLSNDEIKA